MLQVTLFSEDGVMGMSGCDFVGKMELELGSLILRRSICYADS